MIIAVKFQIGNLTVMIILHLHRNVVLKKLKNLPTNVPTKKGNNGTPMTGDVILMNQLGRNGVMRKNMI